MDDHTNLNLLGQAVAEMMRSLLPAAAAMVEEGNRNLAEHLAVLSEHTKAQGSLITTLMKHCREHLLEHELAGLDALAKQSSAGSEAVARAIGGIVTDMQFQDRHSQIMENLTAIMGVYGALLVENATDAERMEQDVLSVIRLREVRSALLQAAHQAGLPFSGAVARPAGEPDETETIELF